MRKPNSKTVKTTLRLVVGACASWTAQDVIKQNVTAKSKAHKAQIIIGSSAIGAIVSESAGQYTDALVDELSAAFKAQKPSDSTV